MQLLTTGAINTYIGSNKITSSSLSMYVMNSVGENINEKLTTALQIIRYGPVEIASFL